MKYSYEFDCRDCLNTEEVNGKTYCVPIRSGAHKFDIDDKAIRCPDYQPAQLTMGGADNE